MYFETYVYYPESCMDCSKQKFTMAAIVFRGTENYEGQRRQDWTDNLAAAFGFDPSQFQSAKAELDGVIGQLVQRGAPGVRIVSAGHSLGGGLAQMAAYYSPEIGEAYAFNSSPVTGWTSIYAGAHATHRAIQNDPKIFRVSQRGEVLHYLRRVSTAVNTERFGRSDFEFDFHNAAPGLAHSQAGWRNEIGTSVSDHDIGLLACQMAARVALRYDGTNEAAFHYTGAMALHALLRRDAPDISAAGRETICTPSAMDIVARNFCPTDGVLAQVCSQAAIRATPRSE